VNNVARIILLIFSLFTAFPAQADDMFLAILHYNFYDVKRLIQQYPSIVHSTDLFGNTPLHQAAKQNDSTITQILLDAGANPNAKSNDNVTPLQNADFYNCSSVTQILLDAGADPNAKDIWDNTPLHSAAFYCQSSTNSCAVRTLLNAGANPNTKDNVGRAPIDRTINKKVKTLLNNFNKLNVQFSKEKNKKLFFQKMRSNDYLSKMNIPEDTVDLFVQNMLMRNIIDINTVHSPINIKHFKLFKIGRLPVRQFKILLAHLNPTTSELSFLWDKSWTRGNATELSKALQSFYSTTKESPYLHVKGSNYKSYIKAIQHYGIAQRTLQNGPFSYDAIQIIMQHVS
jgi:ankyrin repeat protein